MTTLRVVKVSVAEKKYNPDQPRWPAGDPRGGQWAPEGGADIQKSVNAVWKGDEAETVRVLRQTGWSDRAIGKLPPQAKKRLAMQRSPSKVLDWLEDQPDEVVVYHGTSTKRLASAGDALAPQPSIFADIGQGSGVFVVPPHQRRWAEYWANKAAQDGGSPVVLELRIRKSELETDIGNKDTFLIHRAAVPSRQWVSKVDLPRSNLDQFSWRVNARHPADGGEWSVSVNDLFTTETRL